MVLRNAWMWGHYGCPFVGRGDEGSGCRDIGEGELGEFYGI